MQMQLTGSVVPEPGSMLLAGLGLASIWHFDEKSRLLLEMRRRPSASERRSLCHLARGMIPEADPRPVFTCSAPKTPRRG